MRQGSEHSTSNLLVAYPFTDDAPGLVRDDATGLPVDAFADMVVAVPDSIDALYLGAIKSGGILVFHDADDQPVLYTDSVTEDLDASGFQVLDTADAGTRYRFRALVTSAFFEYLTYVDGEGGTVSFDQDLPISTAAIDRDAVSLYSLAVRPQGVTGDLVGDISGHVQVKPGYNMQLLTTDDGIFLNAVPGAGVGVVPCVDRHGGRVVQKPPSQIRPNQTGDVFIQGDGGCVKINTDRALGTVEVADKCGPCCDCSDFARFYNELAGYLNRLTEAKTNIQELHALYNQAVDFWNANYRNLQRSTVTDEVGGILHAMAGPEGAGGRLLVAYIVYNMTCEPVQVAEAHVGQPIHALYTTRKKWTLYRDNTYNDHPLSNVWVPDEFDETEDADEDLMWDDIGDNPEADTVHARRLILEPGESVMFAALLGATSYSPPFGVEPRKVYGWAAYYGPGGAGQIYHVGKLGTVYEAPIATGAARGPSFAHRTANPVISSEDPDE